MNIPRSDHMFCCRASMSGYLRTFRHSRLCMHDPAAKINHSAEKEERRRTNSLLPTHNATEHFLVSKKDFEALSR